jgi:hypothetical protein
VPDIAHDDIIQKEWNTYDVVEMSMGDEDILDFTLSPDIQRLSQTPRIDQDLIIQKKTRRFSSGKLRSRTPQHLNSHDHSPQLFRDSTPYILFKEKPSCMSIKIEVTIIATPSSIVNFRKLNSDIKTNHGDLRHCFPPVLLIEFISPDILGNV